MKIKKCSICSYGMYIHNHHDDKPIETCYYCETCDGVCSICKAFEEERNDK